MRGLTVKHVIKGRILQIQKSNQKLPLTWVSTRNASLVIQIITRERSLLIVPPATILVHFNQPQNLIINRPVSLCGENIPQLIVFFAIKNLFITGKKCRNLKVSHLENVPAVIRMFMQINSGKIAHSAIRKYPFTR